MRRTADYEWLEHTADLRIRVRGPDEAALLESAALAMAELMVEMPAGAGGDGERDVALEVRGRFAEERLMALLKELLYRFDVEAELPVAAHVRLEGERVIYEGRAVRFDPERHEGLREIKAVTWHELEVEADDDGWTAAIVFDV
jgi:SHS2 domain-containing protein